MTLMLVINGWVLLFGVHGWIRDRKGLGQRIKGLGLRFFGLRK